MSEAVAATPATGEGRRRLRVAAQVAIALLAGMAVASALILVYGESPARVYAVMMSHTLGDTYGFGQVLFKATPLLFTGLAVAVAYEAGLFNIGADGQLLAGSFLCAVVGASLPAGAPAILAIPVCLAAAFGGGAVIGAIPGVLKARFGAHEVINTIMLNFIVQSLMLWAGKRWFFVAENVHTAPVVAGARLPGLGLEGSAGNVGLFVALAAAALVWFFLARTRRGYELRAVGRNPSAARAAGIRIGAVTIWAMTLSGGLAGLVGSSMVLGYKGYFEEGMGSGAGFMGIAVALLARGNALAIIAAALLFGTLSHGGLAVNAIIPKQIVEVVLGVIILAVAVTSAELRRGGASWTR